jgi:hypothetical protein
MSWPVRSVLKSTEAWPLSTTDVRLPPFSLHSRPETDSTCVGGRFNHVKIPLDQMLSRFSKLSPEGKYSKPPHDKLAYGGMIFIRAQMIGNLGWQLAKGTLSPSLHQGRSLLMLDVVAVTISTRYLHVRRQFADPELKRGEPGFGIERQVITYPGVYMRVLPQVARAFVFITAGKDMVSPIQLGRDAVTDEVCSRTCTTRWQLNSSMATRPSSLRLTPSPLDSSRTSRLLSSMAQRSSEGRWEVTDSWTLLVSDVFTPPTCLLSPTRVSPFPSLVRSVLMVRCR